MLIPDGIISHLDGPYLGKDNDINIIHQLYIEEYLEWIFLNSSIPTLRKEGLWLYGDQAYTSCKRIMALYPTP